MSTALILQTVTPDTPSDPLMALVQYGALGVFAVVLIYAVRVLFRRETDTLDRERARADALAKDLNELNRQIQERYLTTLEQASSAIKEALTVIAAKSEDRHP